MPPRGVKSAKRKRQYEHIKKSEAARGRSNMTAERIAAATTNRIRAKKGEAKKRSEEDQQPAQELLAAVKVARFDLERSRRDPDRLAPQVLPLYS